MEKKKDNNIKNIIMPWKKNKHLYKKKLISYYNQNLNLNIDSIKVHKVSIKRNKKNGKIASRKVINIITVSFN